MPGPTSEAAAAAWRRAIHGMNGIALGTTIDALATRGAFDLLRPGPQSVEALQGRIGGNPGYLHAALRALAAIGWLEREVRGDDACVTLSARGQDALPLLGAYREAAPLLALAEAVPDLLFGNAAATGQAGAFDRFAACALAGWNLPASPLRDEVAAHLDGMLIAPVAVAMQAAGVLAADAPARRPLTDLEGNLGPLSIAVDLLAARGWLMLDGMDICITPAGRTAARQARTTFYTVRYAPTLRRASELIFGAADAVPSYASGADEKTTRRRHLAFSGGVFARSVADPFYALFLPLFEKPLPEQPRWIIDIGCGDAQMLAHLYDTVETRTPRGGALDAFPLGVVAVEYNALALDAARERLRDRPFLALHGDIHEPAALDAALRAAGVELSEAVLVTKSVIHGRPYRPPADSARAARREPRTRTVFVDRNGGRIPARDMEQSLVELFEKWRPYLSRHGWMLADTHTVDPRVSAQFVGITMQPAIDITHHFSAQHLVEMDVFRAAFEEAGLTSINHRAIGAEFFGHDTMSIDHLVAPR